MEKLKIIEGVYWVEIPEADLYILCGCPADIVKHLMKRGLIVEKVKQGVKYETGPNAILLSDISIQNGCFSNLAEFPILQMLYKQGIIIPNHPNNTGVKPILIGLANQIIAQSQYIYRGNYGLTSVQEIKAAGLSEEIAKEIYNIKLKFAFNQFRKTDELIDYCIVDKDKIEIKNDVFITRKDINVYEFEYKDKSLVVDLNLIDNEGYEPPIQLGFHKTKREYFSILHTGEGDGWDTNRPCMSSIVTFQGKIYLIDAGPNILNSLTSLGISVNEIEGIFHTHAHDDHFAGLTSLLRSDHLIKYYAPSLIRASVVKKLSALMSISERSFNSSFKVFDLKFNKWNNIGGLEVKPVFSPHPVETCIFFFRTLWADGYKTYAHLADIASMSVLEKILLEGNDDNSISHKIYDNITTHYFKKVDVKKIDIGGGLIHGNADDFADDKSSKIILSHSSLDLSPSQKEIGSNATFAMEEVLISANKDYSMLSAYKYLSSYFPNAPNHSLNMLLNCKSKLINVGMIIIKKGVKNKNVYIILNGVGEVIDSDTGMSNILSAGSIIGEHYPLTGNVSPTTYRAASYINVLKIPCELYLEFIKRNFRFEDVKRIFYNQLFLQNSWLFGEMVSSTVLNSIAKILKKKTYRKDESITIGHNQKIYMLKKGEIQILLEDQIVETLGVGGYYGEESIIFGEENLMSAKVTEDSEVFMIQADMLKKIPIIEWKMLETFERRLTAFGTQLNTDVITFC